MGYKPEDEKYLVTTGYGLQTLLKYIERLSEILDISLKSHFTSHNIILFLLEEPHLSKTPDIWIKINSYLPTSNIILRSIGFVITPTNI